MGARSPQDEWRAPVADLPEDDDDEAVLGEFLREEAEADEAAERAAELEAEVLVALEGARELLSRSSTPSDDTKKGLVDEEAHQRRRVESFVEDLFLTVETPSM